MNQSVKTGRLIGITLLIVGTIALLINLYPDVTQKTFGNLPKARDIHLFTVEHKATIDQQETEVYRFDPGQIVVRQGEQIRLHIHGFHGKEHPFSIPEYQISGTIKKGEVKTVEFQPQRLGTFQIICHNHHSPTHGGPMIGYITVVAP